MLDIKYIRENIGQIKEAAKNKKINIDIDELLKIDDKRKNLLKQIDDLRTKRNEISNFVSWSVPSQESIQEGKRLKEEISKLEQELSIVEEDYFSIMVKIPNIPSADTPIGKDDSENVEVYKWWEIRNFDFKPKTYMEIAENLDLIDFTRWAKVAWYRWYYIKNDWVLLQMWFMMYALEKLVKKWFTPMIVPTLIKEFGLFWSWYFSWKKYNQDIDEIYKIANDEKLEDGTIKKENKFLVGTAEPSLLAYYADEILDEKDLPIRFCWFSQCYRSEIWSYGKETKGIYRVHEFMKVEQVVICKADVEEAEKLHQEVVAIWKELHEELWLPYHQIQICTWDLSAWKYKQYDLEAWMPWLNRYWETWSASNFLDWQARRLNVKYKDKDWNKKYVYMMNNTALPSPRIFIAILENYQQEDGSIMVPEVLKKYVGKDFIK